ncbi:MAG: hypothetical protein FWG03_06085 [Clostridiales bacterium]|nr:hypothetical protein [Clostridiales bacterium]
MFKKTLTVVLVIAFALALTLSFGGCGGKDKDDGGSDSLDISIGGPDAEGGDSGGSENTSGGNANTSGGGDADEPDLNYPIVRFVGNDEYPDNEFTRLIPKPDFPIESGETSANFFMFYAGTLSSADAKVYMGKLEKAGFKGVVDPIEEDDFVYFEGKNDTGYRATIMWTPDDGVLVTVDNK